MAVLIILTYRMLTHRWCRIEIDEGQKLFAHILMCTFLEAYTCFASNRVYKFSIEIKKRNLNER